MKRFIALAAAVLAAGCGDAPREPAPEAGPVAEVVVYESSADAAYWPAVFADFTYETGIRVVVRNASDAENLQAIIDKRGSPPADVVIARDVARMLQAVDEGALRPLPFDPAAAGDFVDSDGHWVALLVDPAVIVFDPAALAPDADIAFAALAEPEYADRLCLSSSALPVNRAVLAQLIADLGERPAERAVRYWLRNLAAPIFDSEAALLEAVADGRCAVGIASLSAYSVRFGGQADAPLRYRIPPGTAAAGEVAGVARHAREPDAAGRLLAWLLATDRNREHAANASSLPANPDALQPDQLPLLQTLSQDALATAAWRGEDATRLAERAAYR